MAADLAASYIADFKVFLAPQVGLEPTTLRLTAECSAIELLRSVEWSTSFETCHANPFIAKTVAPVN